MIAVSNTRIEHFPGKGRGVVACRDFDDDDVIESAHVIEIPVQLLRSDSLFQHSMAWDNAHDCIALGHMMLLNHSSNPNCKTRNDFESRTKTLYAIRPIAAGDELTVDYGVPLWFEVVE